MSCLWVEDRFRPAYLMMTCQNSIPPRVQPRDFLVLYPLDVIFYSLFGGTNLLSIIERSPLWLIDQKIICLFSVC